MSEQNLENERDQQTRMDCIDMATRVVGKPFFLPDGTKHHDDVISVALQIYNFVLGK
jgi:Mor family transcriptional regulator